MPPVRSTGTASAIDAAGTARSRARTETSLRSLGPPSATTSLVTGYDVYVPAPRWRRATEPSCRASYQGQLELLRRRAAGRSGNRNEPTPSTPRPSPTPTPPAGGWTFCATEHEQCTFSGTKEVRYGRRNVHGPARVQQQGFLHERNLRRSPEGHPQALRLSSTRQWRWRRAAPGPARDISPPSQPANLSVALVTKTSVSLAWSASTDNVGVTGYGVYVDGQSLDDLDAARGDRCGLACGTAYTVEVDARDAAANRSSRRSKVTASTAPCSDIRHPQSPPASLPRRGRRRASRSVVGVHGHRRRHRLRPLSQRLAGRHLGHDERRLRRPRMQHELHARSRRLRRSREPLGQGHRHGRDDGLPRRDPALLAGELRRDERVEDGHDTQLERVDRQRRGRGLRRLPTRGQDGHVTATSVPQSGLACGTSTGSAWRRSTPPATARPARISNANTSTCSTAPPIPPPAPDAWSGPITITQGGTYSGNWTSTGSTPAVRVTTSKP